jgi:hypothetical protein
MCSRLVSPVKKLLPLRATNCAVSLMTSKSKAEMPSGSGIVYCSWGAPDTVKPQRKRELSCALRVACLVRSIKHHGLEVGGDLHRHLLGQRLVCTLGHLCTHQTRIRTGERMAERTPAAVRTSADAFAPPASSALNAETCGAVA